VENKG
jgi:hypothetical protein